MSAPTPAPGLLAQQQALLDAIWASADSSIAIDYIAKNAFKSSGRGLKTYQSNGHALAQRVLAAAYPVVTDVLSDDSMGQLARALWHAHPPTRGDLAWWGDALPAFMAASPQLASLPWLPDLARLEWALHTALAAPEAIAPADGLASLNRLTTDDPATLKLTWAAATRVLTLDWNVWPIWDAHTQHPPDARAQALHALGVDAAQWAVPHTTQVLLWRPVHTPHCLPVSPDDARFVQALLDGASLLTALEQADPGFAQWLPRALEQGWVSGVAAHPRPDELTPPQGH